MKKALIVILTCCIIVSLVLFIRATDLKMVMTLIQKIGYKFALLLLTTFIAYLFATISWQFALGEYFKCISTGRLFLIRHLGETAGMFNPASVIGGDALKVAILSNYDIPQRAVIWSMLFSRCIMMISQLLLFGTAVIVFVILDPSLAVGRLYNEKKVNMYPLLLISWKAFQLRFSEVLRELPVTLRANKRMLLLSCFFAMLHWVFGGLEFYLILKFLGLKVNIAQALLVDLGVVLFKAAGAFIPGQLGIEEYGNKFMLMAIGIPEAQIWITASILRRARQLVWVAFGIGIYFLLFRKSKQVTNT